MPIVFATALTLPWPSAARLDRCPQPQCRLIYPIGQRAILFFGDSAFIPHVQSVPDFHTLF
ncbi:MAG: hypothetical protein ACU843_18775 [Gammaproteobacteria bacterium]